MDIAGENKVLIGNIETEAMELYKMDLNGENSVKLDNGSVHGISVLEDRSYILRIIVAKTICLV